MYVCILLWVCVCVREGKCECAYTGMQIPHSAIALCAYAHWAFTVTHACVHEKLLRKFCGSNPAYDGQHTAPSRNFIITVIKEKKTYTARKQTRKTTGWLTLHFCSDCMVTHIRTYMQFLIKWVLLRKTEREKRDAWWNPQVALEITPISVVIFRKSTLFSW